MKAHASARFAATLSAVGLLAIGLSPFACAMELNQGSAPSSEPASSFPLPMFLDGARLPDLQDAWRAHFGGGDTAPAPAAASTAEPEATTIKQARETLTRSEQVDRDAAAVRDRAEELSRRFAVDGGDGTEAPAPDPSPAPVSPEVVTTETAAADAVPSTSEAPTASLVPVSASSSDVGAAAAAPASATASDDAPVIEDMATATPAAPAKRSPPAAALRMSLQTAAANEGPFSGPLLRVDPAAPKPQSTPMMPTELRSFGWGAEP